MISLHEGKGPGAKKPVEKVFKLRLTVVGCTPPVWRVLLVRETMWLGRLHDTIQVAFDWFDYQTHMFALDELRLGNPLRRDELIVEDDRDITLADLDLPNLGSMVYHYHFGEGWLVEIKCEQVVSLEKAVHYPSCIAGERSGPPEDCGGMDAYHDMLSCIKEPTTEIGREWLEWLGPEYNSELCDLERINKALRKVSKQ